MRADERDARSRAACAPAARRLGVAGGCGGPDGCALEATSLKYCGEACPGVGATPRRTRVRPVLVAGVQRSGTHFTWEMLNRLGCHVHHEGLGPAGAVSWFFSWRMNSYAINNPESLRDHRFCVVLHQVRHPLRVISSMLKATRPGDRYWQWIYSAEPAVQRGEPLLLQATRLWVAQNERLEAYADARFRVEDTSPRDVCRLAGVTERVCGSDGRHHTTSSKVLQPVVEPQLPRGVDPLDPQSVVLHLHADATWPAIAELDAALERTARAMSARYGYNDDPRYHPQSLDTTDFRAGGREK